MKNHEQLKKLVFTTLDGKGSATARQIYAEIRYKHPGKLPVTFKSFVRVVCAFPELRVERISKGSPMTYKMLKI